MSQAFTIYEYTAMAGFPYRYGAHALALAAGTLWNVEQHLLFKVAQCKASGVQVP